MGGRDEYNPRSSEGPARSSEGPARIIPDPARLLYCPRGCSALKQFSGSGAPPSEDEISPYRTIQVETSSVLERPRCVPEDPRHPWARCSLRHGNEEIKGVTRLHSSQDYFSGGLGESGGGQHSGRPGGPHGGLCVKCACCVACCCCSVCG